MAEKIYKVGEPIQILYQAPNKQTGLTVIAEIWFYDTKDSNFPDITLSEIPDKGVYKGSFTPDLEGEWKVIIHEDVTGEGQVVKRYSVGAHNVHSVGEDVKGVDSKMGGIQTTLGLIDDKIDKLDTPPMVS